MARSTFPAPRILVVEDEEQVCRLLQAILTRRRYQVQRAANGEQALKSARSLRPDLVILDLSLPDISGLEVCRELRTWLAAPILILSGAGEQAKKIAALDLGADDYVTKPFAPGELLARIRALFRRTSQAPAPPPIIASGELRIEVARRRVFLAKQEVRLTRTEFNILTLLAQNADCVVTSKMLLQKALGLDFFTGTESLRVHVGHLRKKIEPDPSSPRYILTEPGVGYRFSTT